MAGELSYKSWKNLVKLTSENITPEGLAALLREIASTDELDNLDEPQALSLLEAISPLPGLRAMLWQGAVEAIEQINKQLPKGVAQFDPQSAAEAIIPYQLDKLAQLLVKQRQLGLGIHEETPKG